MKIRLSGPEEGAKYPHQFEVLADGRPLNCVTAVNFRLTPEKISCDLEIAGAEFELPTGMIEADILELVALRAEVAGPGRLGPVVSVVHEHQRLVIGWRLGRMPDQQLGQGCGGGCQGHGARAGLSRPSGRCCCGMSAAVAGPG